MDAGSAHGVIGLRGGVERGDDAFESGSLSAALAQPDVVFRHLASGLALELIATCVDDLKQPGQLPLVLVEVGAVGGELVARQARVATVAALAGRQQAVPVREDPVCTLIELEHVVQVARVELERAAVGGDLAVAQELALVGLARVRA